MGTPVGFVGGPGETVEIGTGHQSIMPEQWGDDATGDGVLPRIPRLADDAEGQRRPADGSAPGPRGAIGADDTTTPTQATRNKMMNPP